jgi:nucleotide-binding universal stress UspA family protein
VFGAILVGTDAAAKGRHAIAFARTIARLTGDRFILVSVRWDPLVEIPAIHLEDTSPVTGEQRRELRELRDELAPEASLAVQPGASVAEGLRIAARRERAGLVVIGIDPRQGRERPVDRNDDLEVLRRVRSAVLLVPEEQEVRARIERVVVGVGDARDLSEPCRIAAELAQRGGAGLRAVTIVDDDRAGPKRLDRRAAEALIARAVAACDGATVCGDVLRGSVVDGLAAVSRQADLLVLGSHTRGPLPAPSRGGTTVRLLRATHCPVLVTGVAHRAWVAHAAPQRTAGRHGA